MSSSFWQALRTVHIHLSLASLVLLLFFGVSGILLVHAERWGLDLASSKTVDGALSEAAVAGDRLAVVEALRREGAVGALSDYHADDDEIRATFERPSQRCDCVVDRATGRFELMIESRGAWALLLDLHTGKGGGDRWWIALDLAGGLWALVAATGLVLWLQLKKRRRAGILWLAVGTLASLALVAFLSP